MIDIESVTETLCAISGISAQELENYSVLIQNSASVVENSLLDSGLENDSRVVYLAATRAYYNIMLTGTNADDVSDFAAGDIKISLRSQPAESALKLYQEAAEAVSGLLRDNGFVFRGV